MKFKIRIILTMVALATFSQTYAQRPFNNSKDILIAQFDSKPDPDDIHAQAALGSMLAHSDFAEVNFYAVAGAVGKQGGRFIDSDALFDMAFGSNWTDADADRSGSVTRIKNKVKPILENGGKVWVQEAGQSDITRDWIQALLDDGVASSTIKSNVIVVQHSKWNEDMTSPGDLNWVKNNANYKKIADGNSGGNGTPGYRSKNKTFLNQAKNSKNAKAKALWEEADRVIQDHGHKPSHSSITTGGVDYSDCVENWWIFSVGGNADNIAKFWSRYVTNTSGSNNGGGNTGGGNTGGGNTGGGNTGGGNTGGGDTGGGDTGGGNTGGSQTVTLSPIQDAYIQGNNGKNNNLIRIEKGRREGFLMFDLSSINGTVTDAKLRFTVTNDRGNGQLTVHKGNSNNWSETNLSNGNKPAPGNLLGSINKSYELNKTETVDLNASAVSGNSISLVLRATSGSDFAFASKENGGNASAKLVVTYTAASTAKISKNINGYSLFPNPANNIITLINVSQYSTLSATDISGRLVDIKETRINNGRELNISGLNTGVYFLMINDNGNKTTLRFSKK